MKKTVLAAGIVAAVLGLAACGGGGETTTSSGGSSSSGSSGPALPYASGIQDYLEADVETRSEALAALEQYALDTKLGGIPIYDDSGYQLFSPRIDLPSDEYIPNYGFGAGEATLDPNGTMANGRTAAENGVPSSTANYYQSYATEDSGTFNFWNSQGEDVTGKHGMISASYFSVTMNEDRSGYYWRNDLSKDLRPVPLDENGNEIEYTEGMTSLYWRVHLYTAADEADTGRTFRYNISESSSYYSKYHNREIRLEDYLTPYKALLNNNLMRASEMTQDSSGFYGTYDYLYGNANTRSWDDVGIQINEEEGSIDFRFITPQSQFYAMYNLSSSLYSPVPEEYLYDIGGGPAGGYTYYAERPTSESDLTKYNTIQSYVSIGAERFGTSGGGINYLLSTGPYIVDTWDVREETIYTKNELYNRTNEIHFAGYRERVFQNDEAAWQEWVAGRLDDMVPPSTHIQTATGSGEYATMAHRTEGTTTIKLNVNACTEEEWEYYHGVNGTMSQHTRENYWEVKPIMSNEDFLNGVYLAINRQEMANALGRNPALGILSEAYMIDPETDYSYRATPAGQAVIDSYTSGVDNDYGYSPSLASSLFDRALQTLLANGDYEAGARITLTAVWRYQSTIDSIGNSLKGYIENVFNATPTATSNDIRLTINNIVGAVGDYNATYTRMQNGEFDFAEGAISGNVLNPLEFMSVICTNSRSQGFNTNWGERTDLVSDSHPIEFDGMTWSYDGLYVAVNGAAILQNGVNIDPVTVGEAAGTDGNESVWYMNTPGLTDEDGLDLIHYTGINYLYFIGMNGNSMGMYSYTIPVNFEGDTPGATISAEVLSTTIEFRIQTNVITQLLQGLFSNQETLTSFDGVRIIVSFSCEYGSVERALAVTQTMSLTDLGVSSPVTAQ